LPHSAEVVKGFGNVCRLRLLHRVWSLEEMLNAPAYSTQALIALDLLPADITPSDIMAGTPQARALELFRSADGLCVATCWDCSAGTFRWYFGVDETVQILEGRVTVTYEDDSVVTLGVGDVAHFPAGSEAVWHVETYVRKLAICRRALPNVLGFALRATARMMRMVKGQQQKVSNLGKKAALGGGLAAVPEFPFDLFR